MKEITRIHLAKRSYDIEVDARKTLQRYLTDIEKSLQADEDTMMEIEARMVELLAEGGVASGGVVTQGDVALLQQQLGAPNEFVDTEEITQATTQKRLLRDTSNGVLGGVLAGVAAYYSINVLWLRLGAILLGMMSFGAAFIVYAILWVIMPAAKTVADKLQLYGQKVTPSEIKRHIDEFANDDTRRKPLVVIMRCMLALFWIGMALLGALVLVLGFIIGEPSLGSVIEQPLSGWVLVMIALGGISGALFVIFCSVLAYASATWKMNKRIAIVLVSLAIAGIATFSGMIAGAAWRSHQLQVMTVENTHRSELAIGDKLNTVTSLNVEGEHAIIHYVVSSDKSVEITGVGDEASRQVHLENHDGALSLIIGSRAHSCDQQDYRCSAQKLTVTLHGPALESMVVASNNEMQYTADSQAQLKIVAATNTQTTIAGGHIKSITLESGREATFDGTQAAIRTIEANVADGVSLQLGHINELNVNGATACSSGGEVVIEALSINHVRYNGRDSNDGSLNDHCLRLTVDDEKNGSR